MRSTDIIFVPLLAITSAMALGCNRDSNTKSAQAETKTETKTETKAAEEAKTADQAAQITETGRESIVNAARDGLLEVDASQLAEGKAHSEPVKEFARIMVEFHTRSNDELAKLAKTYGIEPSKVLDASGQSKLHGLRDQTGHAFDEAYMVLVIDEHERMIRELQQEAERNDDPSVRAWAAQMLPTLRNHLDRAKTIQSSLEKSHAATEASSQGEGSQTGSQPGGAGTQPEAGGAGSPPSSAAGSQSGAGGTKSGAEGSKSGDTKSGDTKSGGTTSGDTKSGGTTSGNTKSGGTTSGSTKSGGTKSGGTKSGSTKSGGTTSGDTKMPPPDASPTPSGR